ncbi:hypothetical protein C5167_017706 [Papaver somniferum]|uniref:Pollen-specific protein C13 n=1 Tax=Papaver somniferum TaxID=3469 RepID=A0A4Y7IP65_PAPSO|nr:protein DOWNSTREAM OF FLC-like [Papaver somniferum]RZC49279.1 hypothetical protein C5167_017706 [Papaver somniferum]
MASSAMKFLVLFAICVLPAFVSATARPVKTPLTVCGKVYCDTCRAGFETTATTFIAGANVMLECRDRKTMQVHYTANGVTDSTGSYEITVAYDHGDHLCEASLVSSPDAGCAKFAPGRDRSVVILTSNNGVASTIRYANNMGFMADQPMSGCAQVLQQYLEADEDI